jgi:type II secretory pathway component PulC
MIRARRRNPNALLLLSGMTCLAMLIVAACQWLSIDEPIQIETSPLAAPPIDQPDPLNAGLSGLDPLQLAKVIDRPLFSQTRRPPTPPAAQPNQTVAAPAPTAPPPVVDFVLVGIVVVGKTPLALVQTQDGHPAQRLQAGDDFHGWVLTAISDDRAMFRSNGQSKELVLDFHRPTVPAPQ